jgi:hypothetical protein
MADPKTKKTNASVAKFVDSIPNEQRRKDAKALVKIFADVTGLKPTMWGTAIVGYGLWHYQTERSSQKGDWPLAAFSPRKEYMTLYVMDTVDKKSPLLKKLGPSSTSKACLYIKRLSDVDMTVLKKIIAESYRNAKKKFATPQS